MSEMPGGFFEQFFSPEQREQMRVAHERSEMLREEFRHSFQRLFEELDVDNLRTVTLMLKILSENAGTDSSTVVHEWAGIAQMALKMRFNVCMTCGVNHEEEFANKLDEEGDPEEEGNYEPSDEKWFDSMDTVPVEPLQGPSKLSRLHERDIEDVPLPNFYELTETDQELMELYHLDDLRIEGTNELIGFICTGINGMNQGCGMKYPSIEDRMKHEPEHCSGCFTRMGHG